YPPSGRAPRLNAPPLCLVSYQLPRRAPIPPLFPYTTLSRSFWVAALLGGAGAPLAEPPVAITVEAQPFAAFDVRDRTRRQFGLRSEEHTSELQSLAKLACRPLLWTKLPVERLRRADDRLP